jgi:lanosterol synthase
MAKDAQNEHFGTWRTDPTGHVAKDPNGDDKTDYSRWRLHDNDGRLTWVYLQSDEEAKSWPQTVYDKYHLGLSTVRNLCW